MIAGIRRSSIAFWLVITFVVSGCGDSGPAAPMPPATTTIVQMAPPARASITMLSDLIEIEFSPEDDLLLRSRWRITLTEIGGVAAKINFVRQDILNRDFDQFERREFGFLAVAGICGTNVVPANGEWLCDVRFDFNSTNFEGILVLTVGLVDENDHEITLMFTVPLFAA